MIEGAPRPEAGQIFLRDTEVVGLAIRLTPAGTKSWVFEARMQGRMRRTTFGSYPALSVDAARRRAIALRGQIHDGRNPAETRRTGRRVLTFGELRAEYLDRHARERKRSWHEDELRLARNLAGWTARRLDELSTNLIARRMSELARTAGPYEANRTLALVRHMLRKAEQWGHRTGPNPASGIERFPERARERYLMPDEAERVIVALRGETDPYWRAYFLLTLLLGTRRAELLGARWENVVLDDINPTLYLEHTKAGRSHLLPLPEAAASILRALPRVDGSPWVFPGNGKTGHLVDPKKSWERIRSAAGVPDVRIHDLRRTLGSRLAASGYSLPLIGRALNHSQPAATAIYARLHLDPLRAALEANAQALLPLPLAKIGSEFA